MNLRALLPWGPYGMLVPDDKNLWDKCQWFFIGQMPFLSYNQQCQIIKGNKKAPTQTSGLASSFLNHTDSSGTASSPMIVFDITGITESL